MTATTISMPNTAASTRPVGGSIVADTLVIARRNLTRVVRTPQLVFFQTAQPMTGCPVPDRPHAFRPARRSASSGHPPS